MNTLVPGELLVFADYSHCGVYVGNGEVVEATYRWRDGVQITKLSDRSGQWVKHGRLEYVDYIPESQPSTNVDAEIAAHIKAIWNLLK